MRISKSSSIAFLLCIILISSCKEKSLDQVAKKEISQDDTIFFNLQNPQATSLLGESLESKEPSEQLYQRWQEKYLAYENDPSDIDNIIWYGRFTAYMGDYQKAIEVYSMGMQLYPSDSRLYRHRGHRYITTRQFNLAISDFEKAKELIHEKENEVEPDGMPNERGIPVSTLHGNIYYHLGLAHYLKGNLNQAAKAYEKCLATSRMNDNVVSASHWLYMMYRMMNKDEKAINVVKDIEPNWDIIENMSYHKLCLLYNGSIEESEVLPDETSSSANDAIFYGVANWHLYNGRKDQALTLLNDIISRGHWASFGYIAAEAALAGMSAN